MIFGTKIVLATPPPSISPVAESAILRRSKKRGGSAKQSTLMV